MRQHAIITATLLLTVIYSSPSCGNSNKSSNDSGSSEPDAAFGFQIARVATGLVNVVFAVSPPGDHERLFLVERNIPTSPTSADGRIRILSLADDSLSSDAFLTVPDVSTRREQGLLGLAFHPDYESNGAFIVSYTDVDGDTTIERYERSTGDANVADPAPTALILRVDQPSNNHNGGWIGFGPDGYLYIALGDGGAGNDIGPGHTAVTGNAQDTTDNLLGALLRVDVDGPDAFPLDDDRNYAIPESNPFVDTVGDDEIWAYGLRNPWRPSFDRETDDLYIADVGQNNYEELNVQPAVGPGGENYGWRLREGLESTPTPLAAPVGGDRPTRAIDPIFAYAHNSGSYQGCSITGGYVYRGPVDSLQGLYFFADFCSGEIASLRFDESEPDDFDGENFTEFTNRSGDSRFIPEQGSIGSITSFGEDATGNLYVLDDDGDLFRLEPVAE